MMNFFDRAALVDRFARMVPWKLAESLLREQFEEDEGVDSPITDEPSSPGTMTTREFLVHEAIADAESEEASDVVDEEELVAETCRSISRFWLTTLAEVRDLVEDPDPIPLLENGLVPDPALANCIGYEAARDTIISLSLDTFENEGLDTLYAAFVAALRTEMSDKAERIRISDTTVLAIDHGRFTLERVASDSP